jgi:predicted negative regulator of RcsB-dependent stress response
VILTDADELREALAIALKERDEARAELAKHQASKFHPDWSMLQTCREELEEAREEVETLRAAIDGEPWGSAVLKQQRDEAVKKLGITLEQLWAAEKQRDEARAALRTVAERQREAYAARVMEFLGVGGNSAEVRAVHATPLVTENDK